MPAPAAASAATRWPNRRRSSTAATRSSADTPPPIEQRTAGPIQPRLAASANTKAIPSKVTMPPARASPRGPVSHERSIGSRTGRRRSGGSFGIGTVGNGAVGIGVVGLDRRGFRRRSPQLLELDADGSRLVGGAALQQRQTCGQRLDARIAVIHSSDSARLAVDKQESVRRAVGIARRTAVI